MSSATPRRMLFLLLLRVSRTQHVPPYIKSATTRARFPSLRGGNIGAANVKTLLHELSRYKQATQAA